MLLASRSIIADPLLLHHLSSADSCEFTRHKSILDYLHSANLHNAFNALREEVSSDYSPDSKSKYSGLLEKKVNSYNLSNGLLMAAVDKRHSSPEEGAVFCSPQSFSEVLHVMQIMELENRNAQLQEELASAPARRSAAQGDWLPRAPARHVLTGHRMPITRVTFHPVFSVLVSASEDATVKVWDWETGEFERTLKGHTKVVQDVDFDSKGNLLGERRAFTMSWFSST